MMFKSLSIFGKALVGYGINYLLHDNDIKFRFSTVIMGKRVTFQPSTFSEIVRSLLDSIWIAHLQFTLTGRSAHCVFSAGVFYLVFFVRLHSLSCPPHF